ncbi:MAG TPA: hypothetical protein VLC55_12885 [Burkholderiales bacterium]|nr:hypothetical protein [Burkholderiales bacterium]
MFRTLRIFVLLLILAAVALGAWRTRSSVVEWKYTLPVNLYPVNGDGSDATSRYVTGLTAESFRPIEEFMRDEARRHGRGDSASVEVRLQQEIRVPPPQAPRGGNALDVILWSLHMRYWAWRHAEAPGPGPQVRMILVYVDPTQRGHLPHSTALREGLIGLVNVFAAPGMAGENNVVIAHEFLHTLGASDKYDRETNQPLFPDGYADPEAAPLHPQAFAEIMGGRIPLSDAAAVQPRSLNHVVIGPATAREIKWTAR